MKRVVMMFVCHGFCATKIAVLSASRWQKNLANSMKSLQYKLFSIIHLINFCSRYFFVIWISIFLKWNHRDKKTFRKNQGFLFKYYLLSYNFIGILVVSCWLLYNLRRNSFFHLLWKGWANLFFNCIIFEIKQCCWKTLL